jgi:hypothetical protein
MAFEIKVDADAVLRQFDKLQFNVTNLEQETTPTFTDWQREDMHRHFPKVEGSGLSVSTTIYPRSRLPRKKNLAGGASTRRRSLIAAQRPGSHRPILRPELFEQLKQRMIEMCEKAMTWQ